MEKRNVIAIVSIAVVLIAAVIAVGIFSDNFARFKITGNGTVADDVTSISGTLLYGSSPEPFGTGSITFRTSEKGRFRYKAFGAGTDIPKLDAGTDISSWKSISDGDVIEGSDGRNICVASTAPNGSIISMTCYEYVTGVIYGESNPDQYDDPALYNASEPKETDERAVQLASALFKTANTYYYGKDFGYITQGYLSKYSSVAGIMKDYYHTGTDFTLHDMRPFYSPASGEVIYAGDKDDYHSIIIYNEEHDISVLILHGNNVTPTQELLAAGGEVKVGDLLGYGGGAGEPAGDVHVHIEVRRGMASSYASFSKDPMYVRMNNYDPLILSEIFSLTVPEENGYEPFEMLGTSPFNAQSGCVSVQVGNWLYYIDKANGGGIYRARPNGDLRMCLTPCCSANLNYHDGWLYFSNLTDKGYLYKITVNGTDATALAEINSSNYVFTVNDTVYFTNADKHNALCRINTDGSGYAEILNRNITDLFYYGGNFYYTQDASAKGDRIYSYNTANGETKQLIASRADKPFVMNGKLCYRLYYSDKNCLSLPLGSSVEMEADYLIRAAYNFVQPGLRYTVFTNENDGNSLYVKFDKYDENYKLSSDLLCTNLSKAGSWLYYYTALNVGNVLCRIDIGTLEKQVLQPDGMWMSFALECDERLAELIASNRTNSDPKPTATPEVTPEATPETTEVPSAMPTTTATPTQPPVTTPTPAQATPTPTAAPSVEPSSEPSAEPTATASEEPEEEQKTEQGTEQGNTQA